ncbi:MAG: sulfate adenylyltransferase subunit CysD [Aestuariivirga sp.]|uniref:sulfate adenylyltransferase subunit CysD n=1 Tax=Aestuariivirga sp. TaxID=2650926 RepID=UPI0038CF7F3B
MDHVARSFLEEVEAFLASAGLEPTALGKQALGDPNFVFDLRKGRSPSTRTIAKLRNWIAGRLAPAPRQAAPRPETEAAGLTHLDRLEAESIHIIREVAAECEKPVMLYSIGKDSAVMLHLALKAFYPSKPPLPLLHVDTGWKFRDMYAMREATAKKYGLELIVHKNPDGVAKNVNPFDHGSALHTQIMKTDGLKQALDKYGFDAAFGGARRDEEKSRAKERIFSFRDSRHRWDPKNQRPELWNIYNARKNKGESIRVFPLSNWTELDIWQYIHREGIEIVPLYFAAERPVVWRDGQMIMVDDERMRLNPGETPEMRKVRFRTLGCYPLTGAIDSEAASLLGIVEEMLVATSSERQGRVIDKDAASSMEKKKQEGYF